MKISRKSNRSYMEEKNDKTSKGSFMEGNKTDVA